MESNIKKVGTMQVIYTIENNAENEGKDIMSLWTADGVKLCSIDVNE